MSTPRATVRLQFHRGFTLDDARATVGYYADLGISHFYASPLTSARPGSMHGYDVIDYGAINPELGGIEALRRFSATLRENGMGLVLDIVPNHMAASVENRWWRDVLERGRASAFADFFDIDWASPDAWLRGKVLAPFLAGPLDDALSSMRLACDAVDRTIVETGSGPFPIDPATAPDDDVAAYDGASPEGRGRLRALLARQHYVLADWRDAATRINWRRFFDISDLVALRMDRTPVFEAVHRLVFELYGERIIDGVRVDHIDGIADPRLYCERLRDGLVRARRPGDAREPYIVVEKILAYGEELRDDWRVDGTTGYEFMDQCSALLHDARGVGALDALWRELGGREDFAGVAHEARGEVAAASFGADIDRLLRGWSEFEDAPGIAPAIDPPLRRAAVLRLLASFARYRTYLEPGRDDAAEREVLASAMDRAAAGANAAQREALSRLHSALLDAGRRWPALLRAFQQLTPPVAAKALEDTAFYRFGRLISRSEVGADPSHLAATPADFHAACAHRARATPHTLLATATHDHKRGEDVRARLAVLSELASDWREAVLRWRDMNSALRAELDGCDAPSAANESMLYQTLVGSWPPDLDIRDDAARSGFVDRIAAWQLKALREAKLRTSWTDPDSRYERACADFLRMLFGRAPEMLGELERFAVRIGPAGAVNGLVQSLLRLTTPGVPDLYQGCDYWDLSLVDPDNRRPVDHAARARTLGSEDDIVALAADWRDGRVKQALLARVLRLRRAHAEVFARGRHVPLDVEGPMRDHVIAFAREHDGARIIVLAALHVAAFVDDRLQVPARVWTGTRVRSPAVTNRFEDVISGAVLETSQHALAVDRVFAALPLALLVVNRA